MRVFCRGEHCSPAERRVTVKKCLSRCVTRALALCLAVCFLCTPFALAVPDATEGGYVFSEAEKQALAYSEDRLNSWLYTYDKNREELMKSFERNKDGVEQPFGLPASHAPKKIWKTVQKAFPDEIAVGAPRGKNNADAADGKNLIVGGYHSWLFFDEESILQAGAADIIDAVSPVGVWYFFIMTPEGKMEGTIEARSSGAQKVILGPAWMAIDALKLFEESLSGEVLTSPVLLSMDSYGFKIVADTKSGGKAYISSDPEFGVFDAAGLIGFEQERRRTTPRNDSPFEMGTPLSPLAYGKNFEPMEPRPDPAPHEEPRRLSGAAYIVICAGVIAAGGVFAMKMKRKTQKDA